MSPERKACKIVVPPTNYMPAFFGGPPNTRVCMPTPVRASEEIVQAPEVPDGTLNRV